ncbi:MAG: hypothetical protein NTW02_13265 [Cyanobium sp. LacPavin_0920_WC12_MAG_62_9]|nr:hypothetical protein [Cyanobium sp. LacPavin_0920_WC12_MAG_62_9]
MRPMHRLRLELFPLKARASLGSDTNAGTGGSGLVGLIASTRPAGPGPEAPHRQALCDHGLPSPWMGPYGRPWQLQAQ